jgi:hypothetical protein
MTDRDELGDVRVCLCGCGESIAHLRPQARFLDPTHRKRGQRQRDDPHVARGTPQFQQARSVSKPRPGYRRPAIEKAERKLRISYRDPTWEAVLRALEREERNRDRHQGEKLPTVAPDDRRALERRYADCWRVIRALYPDRDDAEVLSELTPLLVDVREIRRQLGR